MKQKTLTIILGMVLLVGIVTATTLTNVSEQLIIPDFIAGGTTSTTFSFDYASEFNDVTHKPLVIRVNISSLEEGYPVGIGDFSLTSFIEQYTLWNLIFEKTIPLNCVEESEIDFPGPDGVFYTERNIPDGIFYCYDPANYLTLLELDRRDKVTLDISSDPALYPGVYSVGVELLEVTSETQQPEDQYINTVSIDAIDDSNMVAYGTNQTVIFNITLEIKGGNAIKMKMSDLTNQYGNNYSAEYLNARLVYEDIEYNVREEYENSEQIIFPWTNETEELVNADILFKIDIKSGMEPGNYHGTYQFNVTKETL